MRTIRQALTLAGTLLAALMVLLSYGAAQDGLPILRTLHNFTGYPDGGLPFGGVVIGPDRVLYGTASEGGTAEVGMVFSLTPPTSPGGAWSEHVLYSFAGSPHDGWSPQCVALGPGGVLYGITSYGGRGGLNNGTVFSLTPPASPGGAWTEDVLYSFGGFLQDDGASPEGIVISPGGVLYGTTNGGGSGSGCGSNNGCGTVFSLTPPAAAGGRWTETVLYSFFSAGSGGALPYTGVVIGSGGELYGTTSNAGTVCCGTVFSSTPPAAPGGGWTETVLYNFTGGSDGKSPYGGVVIGSGGELYGTAFVLAPPASPGGPWTNTVLYSFGNINHDGIAPRSTLVIGSAGELYGTTTEGGDGTGCETTGGCGTVFSVIPPASSGGAWTETILHRFSLTNGQQPTGRLAMGPGGLLYGTTEGGGTGNSGTAFVLMP